MGAARVECVAGCTCAPTTAAGLWRQRESLTQMHSVRVSRHPACRVRLTIVKGGDGGGGGGGKDGSGKDRDGGEDGGGNVDSKDGGGGSSGGQDDRAGGGSKFQLSAVMVSHIDVALAPNIVGQAL